MGEGHEQQVHALRLPADGEAGCVISVDFGADAAFGDCMSSAANAEPIIRPLMAVVIMSFFSIGDPP